MQIVGIEINGIPFLPYHGKDNTTGYFRIFMYYCIRRYFDRIIMTPELNKFFSLAPNDPMFGTAIAYKRVKGHYGMYYSTKYGNNQKIKRMLLIARLLEIDLFLHTIE